MDFKGNPFEYNLELPSLSSIKFSFNVLRCLHSSVNFDHCYKNLITLKFYLFRCDINVLVTGCWVQAFYKLELQKLAPPCSFAYWQDSKIDLKSWDQRYLARSGSILPLFVNYFINRQTIVLRNLVEKVP